MFAAITGCGVIGRAFKQGIWRFEQSTRAASADNKLGYIDDRPFGGGPGMIMMAPPLEAAIRAAQAQTESGRGQSGCTSARRGSR